MDNWILKSAKTIVNESRSANIISPTQVKVKVSHLLLSNFDLLVYSGKTDVEYPRIIGRCAVGIVTEVGEECYGIEKGSRVYFEPTRNCGQCLPCKSNSPRDCTDILYAGKDFDGFLRDFVVCDYNQVAVLPDSLDNYSALCIETVGIAENIYNKLNLSAGQRVAVVGADFSGNIMAQVLQFHKVIPIVIDNTPANLERAKRCGMYYAFAADDDLTEKINNATSGNLCDAVIYCSSSRLPISLCSRIVGNGKTVVLSFLHTNNTNLDVQAIMEKNLTVFGVSHAYGYTDAIINMLLHGAVNLDVFDKEELSEYDVPALLEQKIANSSGAKKDKLTILKMIL